MWADISGWTDVPAAQPAASQAKEIPQRAAEDAAWSIMGRERHLATAVKLVRAEAALTSCREERDRLNEELDRTEQERDKSKSSQQYYSNLLDKEKKAWCDVAAELGRVREERDRAQEVIAAHERIDANKYMEWGYAGGPDQCSHGYAKGIACPQCDLETIRAYRAALNTVSDRQPEGEKP
jgi:hypothetical protein